MMAVLRSRRAVDKYRSEMMIVEYSSEAVVDSLEMCPKKMTVLLHRGTFEARLFVRSSDHERCKISFLLLQFQGDLRTNAVNRDKN